MSLRARDGLAVLLLVLALASTLWTLPGTLRFLASQHSAYADLTREQPNVVPQFQGLLPLDTERFFAARLRRGERYYLQVAPGRYFTGVDLPTAVRTFGRFLLLPAIAVTDPRQAEVILSVGTDPRTLGLRLGRVERLEGRAASVARVRR